VSAFAPDLELLVRAHHPLIVLDTEEDERAHALVRQVCAATGAARFLWNAASGLKRDGEPNPIYATSKLDACLEHIAASSLGRVVYQLHGATELFDEPERAARLTALIDPLSRVESCLVLTGPASALPESIKRRAAVVRLPCPTDRDYYQLVNGILADLRKRTPVSMELSGQESAELIGHLRGLSFFEARKVLTQAMLQDGRLSREDLAFVLQQKREIVEHSGVLEYFSSDSKLEDIAGLSRLKEWLSVRAPVFHDATRAAEYGLSAPRGLLLLGVQGCGKSLCAKAVAKAWNLPLLRLDPARMYDKYLGETEKNLKRAVTLAERLAPIALWIDEIEKVFGKSEGEDSGAAQRMLGVFLTWLQEKQASVFVIATSNDITRLPPELLRKGRFDEIFFVDLPDAGTRADILRVHIQKRRRDPGDFDLIALAQRSEGFSGAELEQVVVSSLYRAFAVQSPLTQAHLLDELARTRPLSATMAEPIAALRIWSVGRTASAD
jgi:AAA+ superfamily predicted ATPase